MDKLLLLLVSSMAVGMTSASLHDSLAALANQLQFKASPEVCLALHCAIQTGTCYLDSDCKKVLECLQGCVGRPDESPCQFECETTLGNGNQKFESLLQCMADNSCFPEVPPDGKCLAEDDQTVQTLTDLKQVEGEWWVTRGISCGQEGWRGGFDRYPCQHARYFRTETGWVNNITCSTKPEYTLDTEIIATYTLASLPKPGIIQLDYTNDVPLLPQVENWKIVSFPSEDYMMVFWCGTNPALDYNGGFVVSRSRTEEGMPAEVEAELRRVATSFGVDYDAMCIPDNTLCIE